MDEEILRNNKNERNLLPFPTATTRDEKMEMINEISERFLQKYEENILAIGVYGSIAKENDGPYSDIEMHVVNMDGFTMNSYEFIYDKFKIEINIEQKAKFFEEAMEVDESWAIKAGKFANILSIYDPNNILEKVKEYPLRISDKERKKIMREFMIWEPYETIGKLRNNYRIHNVNYIPLGAKDLVWQTIKLIGLANKNYYSTRATTYEESLSMKSKPQGYEALVKKVMEGNLDNKELIYTLCENLWDGLNIWYKELGIEYKIKELPF